MEFIYMKHKETGNTFEAPVEDGVRERYEALGWEEVERPDERIPVIPSTLNPEIADTEWITLYHPEVGASHDFPNNTEAVSGAMESGWVYPEKSTPKEIPADDQEEKPPADKPVSKSKVKAPASTTDEEKVK